MSNTRPPVPVRRGFTTPTPPNGPRVNLKQQERRPSYVYTVRVWQASAQAPSSTPLSHSANLSQLRELNYIAQSSPRSPQRRSSRLPPPYSLHGHLSFYDQQCEDAVIKVLPNAFEISEESSIQECKRCIETARFNLDARAEAEGDDTLATLVGRLCLVQEMWSEYERKKAELHEFVQKMEAQTRALDQALDMESGREDIAAEVVVLKGQIGIRRVPQSLVRELVQ
ncbi:hypothetical protein DFP72DRAFT_1046474 [Ephemerocybe angulata]|uniref:Uncharacterized protein n=1 Tax=Ephemerocybe angulata TaxID=980116 RepID=A0A8H6HVL5_9AGAR|nr:hypothetical protein DFP72DRAFT_1046474 [Tulosesus angulatus]